MLKSRSRVLAVAAAVSVVGVSTVLLLSAGPAAVAAAAPGSTVRASVPDARHGPGGTGGGYQQELSADGGAVVFTSRARLDNVDTGGYENVYVRDLVHGRTVMISRGKGDTAPNQSSYQPTISADGRYVAFVSTATNLIAADEDHDQDVVVCDRDPDGDGRFDEDVRGIRAYRCFTATQPTYDHENRVDYVSWPKLSDDATRLVWREQITIDDTTTTTARTASLSPTGDGRISAPVASAPVPADLPGERLSDESQPDVSGDGRLIVLSAGYTVRNADGVDDYHDAIVLTRPGGRTATRVDAAPGFDPARPTYVGSNGVVVSHPVISADGTVLAFDARPYDFTGGTCDGDCRRPAPQPDVYVVHLADGVPVASEIVSRDNDGRQVNGFAPGLSGDGRFVAFVTDGRNTHDGVDVAGRSCLDSPVVSLPPIDVPRLKSLSSHGSPHSPSHSPSHGSHEPSPAPPSEPSSEPPSEPSPEPPPESSPGSRDDRVTCQVVVRDLVTDDDRLTARRPRLPGALASPGRSHDCAESVPEGATCGGNADTTPPDAEQSPSFSDNGAKIAYDSDANDLVADDTDDATDVFVRTFQPQLHPDPAPLDFGQVAVGAAEPGTVRFDHNGIGPLDVDRLAIGGADAGDFTIGDETCALNGAVLQEDGSCLVEVKFAPRTAGDRSATLRLGLSDGREYTVDLHGTGFGTGPTAPPPNESTSDGPRLAAGPDPLDFGARLPLSNGPLKTVTIANPGGTDLTIRTVTIDPPAAAAHYQIAGDTCTTAPLPPGAHCTVSVRFSPAASGPLPAVLAFADDAPGAPHLVGLHGSGTDPEITLSPAVSQPGRVVMVTGKGFAPSHEIALALTRAIQTTKITTAPNGTFHGALLILPKASVGPYPVLATVPNAPGVFDEKTVLVVQPTVKPADFVDRG